ncbi:putative Penicillin-binding protein 1B [Nitrospira sp. KM1]|uniref:penicillin-binding protein 1A n=1 Tax=Nitrospira sp. KM1 TaxID=1936990 RepID=UPI0013A752FA|nr:PBP1A family penicillin-binding protein [Nitrospira sp. KM1]BCA54700.1 putative Penicillin-binding protein 1B [Nitrospira sp. KM1]
MNEMVGTDLSSFRIRKYFLFLGIAIALLGAVMGVYGAYLATFLELPKGEDHPPLRLYAAPFQIKSDLHVKEARLADRLQRLGYKPVKDRLGVPGDYRVTGEALTVYLHGQPEQLVRPNMVKAEVEQDVITRVLSEPDGSPIFPVYLEPELISGLRGASRQVREWIPLEKIPPRMVNAVVAVEDRRFYSHIGIDPVAIGRAVWRNLTRGGLVQGGSTITQQLAKNLFYSPQRTFVRKMKEALAAVVLEVKYRKQEILESYLNEIYLGQAGFVSIYGVGEAGHRYFGKALSELSTGETAVIAGLIKGPNTYAPTKNITSATQRRDTVLRVLREQDLLTEHEWKAAVNEPLRVAPSDDVLADAPYFVDTVLRQVEDIVGTPLPEGLRIDSTLDPILQQAAGEALEAGLAKLERSYPALKNSDQPLQGAVVILDPSTGSIAAMVGGRDYRVSQFNRAVQARRQVGSLLKPFVYLAAFEGSREGTIPNLTAATLLADEPVTFESETGTWTPRNYDRQFRGTVTVRAALEQSLNVPAVRVAKAVGPRAIVDLLRRVGLTGALPEDLSIALGSPSATLLEITSAYGAVANGGVWVRPTAVRAAIDRQGQTLWSSTPDRRQAVSPQAAFLATSLMEGVIRRGTAARAKTLGLNGAIAGKTGTTDGYRDSWFVGYSSEFVVGVWVGFDDEQALRLTGAQAALPIWMEVARKVIPSRSQVFHAPSGVVTKSVDPKTGQLATSQCPEQVAEVFIEGTEPSVYCEIHGGGLWERFRQTFGLS